MCEEVKGREGLIERERFGWAGVVCSGEQKAVVREVVKHRYFLFKEEQERKKLEFKENERRLYSEKNEERAGANQTGLFLKERRSKFGLARSTA